MTSPWYRRHVRVVHTILRTMDVPGYDPDAYVRHCLALNGNTLVINGGGLFAFYPTEVPGHVRVPGLERDIVGDVTEAAHQAGLRVLLRLDFRAAHPEVYAEHPDWFATDVDGEPIRIRDWLHSAAATSPYRNEAFAIPVLDELLQRYPVDGIWENAPSFMTADPDDGRVVQPYPPSAIDSDSPHLASWGLVDYSPPTRERFRADTGLELPHPDDFDPTTYARFMSWRGSVLTERTRRVHQHIHGYGDHLAYISEGPAAMDWGWSHHSGLEMDSITPHWDILAAPTFDLTRGSRGSSHYPSTVWRPEEAAKLLRAGGGGRVPTIMMARFDNLSRHTTVAEPELDLWLAGAVANGAGAWECTFVGRESAEFLDQRGDGVVAASYALMAELGDDLDHGVQVADVLVVHSQETESWFGSSRGDVDGYVQHVRGTIAALFESHTPFDMATTRQLTAELLAGFRVVVLPNAALLSDEVCQLLGAYVAAGGGLVTTYQTGCFTLDAQPRAQHPLGEVLGVSVLGEDTAALVGPHRYAYGRITRRGPVTAGLEQTQVVTTEGHQVPVEAAPDRDVDLRLIATVKPQPPELGWVEDMSGDLPLVVSGRHGEGRTVYLSGQQDKLAIATGHPDYTRVLANAIHWASGVEPLTTSDAPSGVHVNVMGRDDNPDLLIHLVNYTSGPGRPIRDITPVRDVTVRLRWPSGRPAPSAVTDRLTGDALPFIHDSTSVRIVVPEVRTHAVVSVR